MSCSRRRRRRRRSPPLSARFGADADADADALCAMPGPESTSEPKCAHTFRRAVLTLDYGTKKRIIGYDLCTKCAYPSGKPTPEQIAQLERNGRRAALWRERRLGIVTNWTGGYADIHR